MRALLLLSLLPPCAATAQAQTPSGMAAMQYFAGTWVCEAGPVAGPTQYKIKLTFTIDSGIMREWDSVAVPGVSALYSISKTIAYDAGNDRWVQSQVDDQGRWRVSYVKPWTGNTEEWVDQSSSDGKLGRDETVRTDANAFAFSRYAGAADPAPRIAGRCSRST